MKSIFKFLITSFILVLLFLNSICFATDTNYETMLISDTPTYQEPTTTDSDLYITDSEYEITNTVNGNVFVLSDKFVLKSECEINGDLYICAKEVHLEQYSKISGNVFICSSSTILNAEISGSLYVVTDYFDMQYFAFISRDLHLTANQATLNGLIYRNSFIEAKNITTNDKFINQGNFNIKDADKLTFSGEILGNASINAKSITLKSKENDNSLTCKIAGNLSYSSIQEIQIPEGIILKEITYSSYTNTSSNGILSDVLDYVLSIIGLLILAHIIYVLLNKFAPKYLDKISCITIISLLKYLGIGLGLFILIPIISIISLISRVGIVLAILLLLIYIILIIISRTLFIIAISKFAKNRIKKEFSIYLYILVIDIILSLISLIPYLGFITSILISLIGFGMITKNLIPNKKK